MFDVSSVINASRGMPVDAMYRFATSWLFFVVVAAASTQEAPLQILMQISDWLGAPTTWIHATNDWWSDRADALAPACLFGYVSCVVVAFFGGLGSRASATAFGFLAGFAQAGGNASLIGLTTVVLVIAARVALAYLDSCLQVGGAGIAVMRIDELAGATAINGLTGPAVLIRWLAGDVSRRPQRGSSAAPVVVEVAQLTKPTGSDPARILGG